MCSLVYGYFTALKFSAAKCATVSLPILQCQSKDIVLSKEVTYVFELLDIDVSELIYQDDISPDVLSTANKLSLILVDHNSPTRECYTSVSCSFFLLSSFSGQLCLVMCVHFS